MAEGNGADLGSIVAMLGQVVSQIGQIGARLDRMEGELTSFRKDTKREFASLRQEVALYHGSVTGHGIAISDLEDRVQRIEHHLNLPPKPQH